MDEERRERLREWPLEFIDPPSWDELEKRGIESEPNKNGCHFYYLSAAIRMARTKERMMITTRILAPGDGK